MWTQMLTMDSKCISICRGWMWCSKSMDKKPSVQLLYLYSQRNAFWTCQPMLIYGGSITGMNQNPLNYGWTTVTTHYSFWLWMVWVVFVWSQFAAELCSFYERFWVSHQAHHLSSYQSPSGLAQERYLDFKRELDGCLTGITVLGKRPSPWAP